MAAYVPTVALLPIWEADVGPIRYDYGEQVDDEAGDLIPRRQQI